MRKIVYSCDICGNDYMFQTRDVRMSLKIYDDDGIEESIDLCPVCLTRIENLITRIKNETKRKQAKED